MASKEEEQKRLTELALEIKSLVKSENPLERYKEIREELGAFLSSPHRNTRVKARGGLDFLSWLIGWEEESK